MDGVINNYGRIGDLSGAYQSSVPTSQAISIIGSNNTINNLNVPNLGVGTIEASSSAIFIADMVTNNQINNDGFIKGTSRAISMGTASPGGNHTIQNTGMILSDGINSGEGVAIQLAGTYNHVYNAGGIYGVDTGIAINGDNNTVINQGLGVIQGGVAGINITPSSPLMGTTQITNYGVIRGVDSILTNTGSPVGNLIVSNAGTLDGNLDLSTPTNARLEIFGQQAQILSSNAIVGGSNAIFSVGSLALGTAQFTLRSDVSGFNQMQVLSGSTLNFAANQVTNYAQTFIGVGHFFNDGRLIVPAGHQLNIFGDYSQS
jgi:hypothetical protein